MNSCEIDSTWKSINQVYFTDVIRISIQAALCAKKQPELVRNVNTMFIKRSIGIPLAFCTAMLSTSVSSQEINQFQHWLDLAATDQTFADRSAEIGRSRAFLEFLGEDSTIFRDGPVDALERYSNEDFQEEANEIGWEAHYIDVSRAGDLGLTAGPLTVLNTPGEQGQDRFGHLISIWRKIDGNWRLMADLAVFVPGFLSLAVEPSFDDTQPVFDETAHPAMAMVESNTMQSLVDADNLFGRNINFRGGQRALLRYGLENSRVYLPGMAPAVGVESASSVYGAFLDDQLATTNPVSLSHWGGYLSDSKDMGYTYGTMATNNDSTVDGDQRFRANYLRLWRFTSSNEWKIAVESVLPY